MNQEIDKLNLRGIWVNRAGEKFRVEDMDTPYCLAVLRYLIKTARRERQYAEQQSGHDNTYYSASTTLQGEGALASIGDWGNDPPYPVIDYLEDLPFYRPLVEELKDRGVEYKHLLPEDD